MYHGKRMKQKLICTQGNLYTTPGATRHPLLKKGAREAPFFRRGWPEGPGVVYTGATFISLLFTKLLFMRLPWDMYEAYMTSL